MAIAPVIQTRVFPGRTRSAKYGLLIFFAFLLPLSLLGYWLWIAKGNHLFLIYCPAVSAILTRLIRREGFRDVSFRFGGWRTVKALLLALLFPLIVGIVAYGVAWTSGVVHFSVMPIPKPFPSSTDSITRFALWIVLAMTVITAIYLLTVLGEEIGWRGYMLTRLIDANVPRPLLITGLIWGAWHVPLILSGSYGPGGGPNPLLAVALFMVTATAFAYLLAWIRLRTGSIWPCIVAHAAWNGIIGVAFNGATKGVSSQLWTGESGLLVALVVTVAVVLVYRLWPLHQRLLTPSLAMDAREPSKKEEHEQMLHI